MDSLPPIPTPAAQRWREFRIEILPLIVFVCTLVAIALMWRTFVQPSGAASKVEAVKGNSAKPQEGVVSKPVHSLRKTIVGAVL